MHKLVIVFAILCVVTIAAYDYELIFENEDLYNTCDGFEDKTFRHIFDLSNFSMIYDETTYQCDGTFTSIWDAEPTDRIALRVVPSIYRFGKWGPTTFNFERRNGCDAIFDKNQFFYEVWFQYIVEEDQGKCFNDKGMMWHYKPFELTAIFRDIPGPDVTGLYKLTIYIMLYNKKNIKKDTYCFTFEAQIQRVHYD